MFEPVLPAPNHLSVLGRIQNTKIIVQARYFLAKDLISKFAFQAGPDPGEVTQISHLANFRMLPFYVKLKFF